jgi:hypothetical protein
MLKMYAFSIPIIYETEAKKSVVFPQKSPLLQAAGLNAVCCVVLSFWYLFLVPLCYVRHFERRKKPCKIKNGERFGVLSPC